MIEAATRLNKMLEDLTWALVNLDRRLRTVEKVSAELLRLAYPEEKKGENVEKNTTPDA